MTEDEEKVTIKLAIFMSNLKITSNFVKGWGIFRMVFALLVFILLVVSGVSIEQKLLLSNVFSFVAGFVWWGLGKRIVASNDISTRLSNVMVIAIAAFIGYLIAFFLNPDTYYLELIICPIIIAKTFNRYKELHKMGFKSD